METSEFTEFNGNFEIPNFTLEVLEICGQKRAVLRQRAFDGSLKECRLTGSYSHCEYGVQNQGCLSKVFHQYDVKYRKCRKLGSRSSWCC